MTMAGCGSAEIDWLHACLRFGTLAQTGPSQPGMEQGQLSLSQGLQSDREFAETFARSRWRQYRWAASRIRIELMKKGVSKENLDHALHELFGEQYTVRLHNDTVDEHDLEGAPLPSRIVKNLQTWPGHGTRAHAQGTWTWPVRDLDVKMRTGLMMKGHLDRSCPSIEQLRTPADVCC